MVHPLFLFILNYGVGYFDQMSLYLFPHLMFLGSSGHGVLGLVQGFPQFGHHYLLLLKNPHEREGQIKTLGLQFSIGHEINIHNLHDASFLVTPKYIHSGIIATPIAKVETRIHYFVSFHIRELNSKKYQLNVINLHSIANEKLTHLDG